ncbi:MAG: hypothetical protein IJQ02_08530 [Oscillospiraceae bacterium]|nr:hypothetical protein [Oscillospiraceae bacterium]
MEQVMKSTRRQCMLALFSAQLVVICVFIGVTMNLTTLYDENFDHMGIRTFCMFTVNSNILAAISMAMIIPYTVDGIRKNNYHLPRWVTVFAFAGVTAVTLTFLISLFILSPVKGFHLIFSGSRFFLHGVCPILAFLAFCFFMSEQRVSFQDANIAVFPVLIYAIVYFVMVVVIGEEKGGWNDFYGFATRIPLWISVVLVMPLTFGISSMIRFLHNRSYRKRKEEEAAGFEEAFHNADLRSVVKNMAREQSAVIRNLDILIPKRVISIMLEHSDSGCTLDELCELYLKEYLGTDSKGSQEDMWT